MTLLIFVRTFRHSACHKSLPIQKLTVDRWPPDRLSETNFSVQLCPCSISVIITFQHPELVTSDEITRRLYSSFALFFFLLILLVANGWRPTRPQISNIKAHPPSGEEVLKTHPNCKMRILLQVLVLFNLKKTDVPFYNFLSTKKWSSSTSGDDHQSVVMT